MTGINVFFNLEQSFAEEIPLGGGIQSKPYSRVSLSFEKKNAEVKNILTDKVVLRKKSLFSVASTSFADFVNDHRYGFYFIGVNSKNEAVFLELPSLTVFVAQDNRGDIQVFPFSEKEDILAFLRHIRARLISLGGNICLPDLTADLPLLGSYPQDNPDNLRLLGGLPNEFYLFGPCSLN
jgi:hypothetical protein